MGSKREVKRGMDLEVFVLDKYIEYISKTEGETYGLLNNTKVVFYYMDEAIT